MSRILRRALGMTCLSDELIAFFDSSKYPYLLKSFCLV